jgi:hypothetical protein
MTLRLALTALLATLGWWLGILLGSTVGGLVGIFASPIAGRITGGLLAGLIGAAIEARATPSTRGKRLPFTGASAVTTALVTVLLLDVRVLPWLVGGTFGAALALAQAGALGLGCTRSTLLRTLTSTVAWSLGFVALHAGGGLGKVGVLAPGLAVVLLALTSRHRNGSPDVRLASRTAILS